MRACGAGTSSGRVSDELPMKENHEKTGLAAFILSLAAVLSLGIAVIPALICALISKRQSEAAGVPTDGFATASMVISGFILALWALVIFGGSALLFGLGYKMEIPNLSEWMEQP